MCSVRIGPPCALRFLQRMDHPSQVVAPPKAGAACSSPLLGERDFVLRSSPCGVSFARDGRCVAAMAQTGMVAAISFSFWTPTPTRAIAGANEEERLDGSNGLREKLHCTDDET